MTKMILYQPWGGLGDNLQFSTLPELCHENGIDFYLSVNNSYRNTEIKELVWDLNPFVKGISSEPHNAGYCKVGLFTQMFQDGIEFIKSIEKSHGFEPKNKLPRIFYQPKNINYFNDKTVVCLTSVSETYDENSVLFELNKLIKKHDYVVELKFNENLCGLNSDYGDHKQYISSFEKYVVKDIYEHCDIIFSAKKYICLYSGNSVLASTIRNKDTYVITQQDISNNSAYYFENLKYIKIT